MPASWKKKGLIAGLLLSAVLMGVFFVRLDWTEFSRALAAVQWSWVLMGWLVLALTISVRAARWCAVAGGSRGQLRAYWDATVVGYAGNVLYPGRAGEVIRIAALHRSLKAPPGHVVASAMIDRVMDLTALGVVASYIIGVAATGFSGDAMLLPLAAVAAVPIGALIGFLAFGARLQPVIARLASRLPGLWKDRIPRWYLQAFAACRGLASTRRLAKVLALTALACALDYTALWLILAAFQWSLPYQAAMLIAVLLALGSLVPAAPGYVGIYQVACVLALRPYGVPESSALAYSVVAQGSTLLIIAALGSIAAARYGFSLLRRA